MQVIREAEDGLCFSGSQKVLLFCTNTFMNEGWNIYMMAENDVTVEPRSKLNELSAHARTSYNIEI